MPAAEIVQRVRELAPIIAAAADQAEHDRRLSAALVQSLHEAGLFRLLLPESLGGGETDLATFALAIEEVAKADGSTAWCLAQGAGSAFAVAQAAPAALHEIFAAPEAAIAWGPGSGTAVITDGGYSLSGRWSFASGCHHATWLGGDAAVVQPNGRPALDDRGLPKHRMLLFPAAAATMTEIWDVSGLRGTGSDAYAVTDLSVSEAYALGSKTERRRTPTSPLHAFTSASVYPAAFASVALGIARAALDAFIALAAEKTPRGAKSVLRENAVIQSQVARAEAELQAAHALLHTVIADAWAVAASAGEISLKERMALRLATTFAIHASARVVDTVYHAAGATAIFANNAFERRFRDVHAVTQQIQGSQAHFETVGRYLLGVETEFVFV
ncbi:MAG: acyl-CoA dehydrogenase family protein [Dehalococcoidia bacterium]